MVSVSWDVSLQCVLGVVVLFDMFVCSLFLYIAICYPRFCYIIYVFPKLRCVLIVNVLVVFNVGVMLLVVLALFVFFPYCVFSYLVNSFYP